MPSLILHPLIRPFTGHLWKHAPPTAPAIPTVERTLVAIVEACPPLMLHPLALPVIPLAVCKRKGHSLLLRTPDHRCTRSFSRQFLFYQRTNIGVAASKNREHEVPIHRSGTNIYRKKIDTQKVYTTVAWQRSEGAKIQQGTGQAFLTHIITNVVCVCEGMKINDPRLS